jgi:hypothetical protein
MVQGTMDGGEKEGDGKFKIFTRNEEVSKRRG